MSESFTICGIKPTAEVGNQTFGIRIGHCRDGRGPQCAEYTWPEQSSIRLQTVNAVGVRSRLVVMLGSNLMNTRTLAAALAGATLFGLTAVPARAQTAAPGVASPPADAKAAPKPKPKANRAGAVTVTVMVTNSRKVDLVQLQAAESGSADWKQVLGPVKSGKQASAKLPQASDCRFDLRGTFDDGQSMDASGIDVCADKTLNLTD